MQQYSECTMGQLYHILGQTQNLDEAKAITTEALRRLKMNQIMRHQPRMYKTRKERTAAKRKSRTPSPIDEKPWYVNRDMSLIQSDSWDYLIKQVTQQFNNWHLSKDPYQPTIDADVYSRPDGDVTALVPIAIPKQPDDNRFDALADTPAVASPLETLAWLHAPNSPSLGKRAFDSETGPSTPRYGPAEYDAITGLTGLTSGPTEPSGSNEQDNSEDRKAKKARISRIVIAKGHWHRSIGIPDDMTPEEYEARDNCANSLGEYWQPEDNCYDMEWSHGNDWNTNNAPDDAFMGNDLCLEEEHYNYNTDSTYHFSHSPYYT